MTLLQEILTSDTDEFASPPPNNIDQLVRWTYQRITGVPLSWNTVKSGDFNDLLKAVDEEIITLGDVECQKIYHALVRLHRTLFDAYGRCDNRMHRLIRDAGISIERPGTLKNDIIAALYHHESETQDVINLKQNPVLWKRLVDITRTLVYLRLYRNHVRRMKSAIDHLTEYEFSLST